MNNKRIQYVLGALVPSNIAKTVVLIEESGVAIQEYRYRRVDLERFREGKIGEDE